MSLVSPELAALLATLHNFKPSSRITAIKALSGFDLPEVRQVLTETMLEDEDDGVRKAAATTLGDLGSPDSIEQLMVVLQNSAELHVVRRAAAEALGHIGSQAFPTLTTAFASQDSAIRVYAVWGLLYLEQDAALELLLKALNDVDSGVRLATTFVLGQLDDERAVPFLLPILHDSEANVRYGAVQALALLGATEALSALEKLKRDYAPTAWSMTVAEAARQAIIYLREEC